MQNWALNAVFERAEDCAIAAETLAAVLEDLGALGWYETTVAHAGKAAVVAFFPSLVPQDQAIERVRRAIEIQRSEGALQSPLRLLATVVEEHDWATECRRGFRGLRVARGLYVVPPWRARSKPNLSRPGMIEIVINPGMAFGTGLHETTRLCLRLLRHEIRGGERVADLGAGSGILSIGAILFGAQSALAIEVDPQAHENLLENIRLNGLGRRVRVFKGDVAQYVARFRQGGTLRGRGGFDLIVCNILFEKMRLLAGDFHNFVRPGRSATVILSGHLWSERHAVAAVLSAAGVHIAYGRKMGDWGAMVGRISS